jgi:hypothetical protein
MFHRYEDDIVLSYVAIGKFSVVISYTINDSKRSEKHWVLIILKFMRLLTVFEMIYLATLHQPV